MSLLKDQLWQNDSDDITRSSIDKSFPYVVRMDGQLQISPSDRIETFRLRQPLKARSSPNKLALGIWSQHRDIADACGCYVFGVRNGRGTLPGYVGKAAAGFAREVFQPHKLNRYHEYLAHTRRGSPLLFFLVIARTRGKVNERAIMECELELITLAKRTNPNLTNVRGTREPAFVIPHVTEGAARGRPSRSAQELCRTLGIEIVGGDQNRRIAPLIDRVFSSDAMSATASEEQQLGWRSVPLNSYGPDVSSTDS